MSKLLRFLNYCKPLEKLLQTYGKPFFKVFFSDISTTANQGSSQ
ncbi:MAG: hypothetical protein PUC50_17270 [Bacteroidales bacterium]|nr:hypothetical protein [Bacteroidales bacterium]